MQITKSFPLRALHFSFHLQPVFFVGLLFFLAGILPLSAVAQVELVDRNGDGEIIFLAFGDSITFGVGDGFLPNEEVSSVAIIPGTTGYPGRLSEALGLRVRNGGVPGELMTVGGISRFASELGSSGADYVIVLEGANDSFFQVSSNTYRVTVQSMVNIANALNVEPILLTVAPTCCDRAGLAPFVTSYSRQVRDVGASNDIFVIDLEVAIQQACTEIESCELLNRPEGLHPNSLGYDFIAATLAEIILGPQEEEEEEEEEENEGVQEEEE